MTQPGNWYPALPAQSLPAAGAVLAASVHGQDLALWRSASGSVQAWEDRCPHRGVALSLGRVLGDRLACAYHGWEYAAGDGRCVAIPAMPQQPVPGKVCVKTFAAAECQGMVWVAPGATPPRDAPPVAATDTAPHFLRSMAIAAPWATVEAALADPLGFTPAGPCQWRGHWAGHGGLLLWTLDAAAHWCLLHVASAAPPPQTELPSLFGALRLLRERLHSAADT